MKTCPNGHESDNDEAAFCALCGAELTEAPPAGEPTPTPEESTDGAEESRWNFTGGMGPTPKWLRPRSVQRRWLPLLILALYFAVLFGSFYWVAMPRMLSFALIVMAVMLTTRFSSPLNLVFLAKVTAASLLLYGFWTLIELDELPTSEIVVYLIGAVGLAVVMLLALAAEYREALAAMIMPKKRTINPLAVGAVIGLFVCIPFAAADATKGFQGFAVINRDYRPGDGAAAPPVTTAASPTAVAFDECTSDIASLVDLMYENSGSDPAFTRVMQRHGAQDPRTRLVLDVYGKMGSEAMQLGEDRAFTAAGDRIRAGCQKIVGGTSVNAPGSPAASAGGSSPATASASGSAQSVIGLSNMKATEGRDTARNEACATDPSCTDYDNNISLAGLTQNISQDLSDATVSYWTSTSVRCNDGKGIQQVRSGDTFVCTFANGSASGSATVTVNAPAGYSWVVDKWNP